MKEGPDLLILSEESFAKFSIFTKNDRHKMSLLKHPQINLSVIKQLDTYFLD